MILKIYSQETGIALHLLSRSFKASIGLDNYIKCSSIGKLPITYYWYIQHITYKS